MVPVVCPSPKPDKQCQAAKQRCAVRGRKAGIASSVKNVFPPLHNKKVILNCASSQSLVLYATLSRQRLVIFCRAQISYVLNASQPLPSAGVSTVYGSGVVALLAFNRSWALLLGCVVE